MEVLVTLEKFGFAKKDASLCQNPGSFFKVILGSFGLAIIKLVCMDPWWHPVLFLTFDKDLCCGLNDTQVRYGHACVVRGLVDVCELQDVTANRKVVLLRQLNFTPHPLHKRHWRANCHTGEVNTATRHHLLTGGGDGETRRHTANWKKKNPE